MNSDQEEELAELHDSLLQVGCLHNAGITAVIIAAFIEFLAEDKFLWYAHIKKFIDDEQQMRLIRFRIFHNMPMIDLTSHQENLLFQETVSLVSSMLKQAQQSNDEEQPYSKRFRSF